MTVIKILYTLARGLLNFETIDLNIEQSVNHRGQSDTVGTVLSQITDTHINYLTSFKKNISLRSIYMDKIITFNCIIVLK